MSTMDELQIGVVDMVIEDVIETTTPVDGKMSDKVMIRRFPSQHTLVGPPTIIMPIDDACDALAGSTWMRQWVANRIKEAMVSGEVFNHLKRVDSDWRGRADGLVGQYKLASENEVLNFVDTQEFSNSTGHAVSKRAQERGYTLHYHEGATMIERYDNLPRQARVILDLMNDTGRENFTEASIEMLLSSKADALKTKQDPMKIFLFYRKRLVDDGHLEEVG